MIKRKGKTYRRKKSSWKSSRAAWADVAKKTGLRPSKVTANHSSTHYGWKVK